MKKTKQPVKVTKTPASIQRAIDFAKSRQHFWAGEKARAEACVTCPLVGLGCAALCPHL